MTSDLKISPELARKHIQLPRTAVFLDVREPEEWIDGTLPGAAKIPRKLLESKIQDLVSDQSLKVIVYCASGIRSLLATQTLRQMGYLNAFNLEGGINLWRKLGYEIEVKSTLSAKNLARYKRHLTLPQVGELGQLKLLQSKVLLVGVGGLGSPIALYLTAAGVGTLGLLDFDLVEESNLQRQIIHDESQIGSLKVDSASNSLKRLRKDLNIVSFNEKLTSKNIERIFPGFDVIVDGTDNFSTRYLINDACVKLSLPLVHGSVYQFEGQVSVFDHKRGSPCYRCLYPQAPSSEFAPSCSEAGVLGVLPGMIGILQSIETIKILLGIGETLVGRLLNFDALSSSFQTFNIQKNPECAVCSRTSDFPDYEEPDPQCSI